MLNIKKNYIRIKKTISDNISIVAASKTRTPQEILQVIEAGANIIGENYVQEAFRKRKTLEHKVKNVKWHMIGHLQTNKVKKAVQIFDMIETVDSEKIANEIDKEAKKINKKMPVLIEINSGREKGKFGIFPERVEELINNIYNLNNIIIMGLMTMGPLVNNQKEIRRYFRETKTLFDRLKSKDIEKVNFKYLSMGMTNSYKIAVEEGSNMVRIGSAIFGERKS